MERLADRVAIIRQGEIVESGTLDELRHLTSSTITLETETDVSKLSNVEGVFDFKQHLNQATFSADNKQLSHILNEAAKLGVKKFESTPPTLEELFMRHYENKKIVRCI